MCNYIPNLSSAVCLARWLKCVLVGYIFLCVYVGNMSSTRGY